MRKSFKELDPQKCRSRSLQVVLREAAHRRLAARPTERHFAAIFTLKELATREKCISHQDHKHQQITNCSLHEQACMNSVPFVLVPSYFLVSLA